METLYTTDFDKFLSHTDEKLVLLEAITEEIKNFEIKSLLDIGAGNGLLAIPVSQKVEQYLAIEPKEKYAKILREAGLEVIEDSFPTRKLTGAFDGILASHVISYENDNYREFILSAWKNLRPGGAFLLITHKGEENEWIELLEESGLGETIYSQSTFEEMKKLLESLGNLEVKKLVSHVTTDSLDDLVQALSFVASDGILERKKTFMKQREKLEEILKEKYYQNGKYSFPFNHFLLVTRKVS